MNKKFTQKITQKLTQKFTRKVTQKFPQKITLQCKNLCKLHNLWRFQSDIFLAMCIVFRLEINDKKFLPDIKCI